ncbi:MAG: hypothetical protein IJQ55_04215, partial [Alphaproteobacteria bacterium]|nr:hypothetical protein [Alphaproteobacteria bacterium]
MTKSKETNVIDANELLEKVRTKAHKILEKHNTKICTFSFADRGWQSRNWSSSEGIPDLYMVKFQMDLFEPFERDFWYEKRGDIEIATTFVKSTKPWLHEPVANRMVLKLKNIMFYCDFEARTAFFIKDGIKVSWREGEPIKYKDKSGVEYTLADYIFPHGIFGYRRENIIYDLDGFSLGNSWETMLHTDMWKFLENFDFLSVNEKYPDGTYREFDKDGRIIKDVSPDGTETIYAYPQELSLAMNKEEKIFKLVSDVEFVLKRISKTRISLVLKKVVKANETLYYLNNSYAGKVVTQKETEKRGLGEIVSGTYTYDSRDKLVESIETEYHFYPKSSQKVYKTYKSEYFDNGNIKSKECISGVHSGDTIYYDPENNGKEIAHTTHNNSLLFAFNDPKARKAMKKSFEIAMKQGNMKEAKMALEAILNSFAGLKPDYFHTGISLMVRGELIALDIKVLDDNKIAIGSVYENRYWVGTTPLLRGNGIEWN